MARRYSQRPSTLVGLPPEIPAALDFDVAIAHRALNAEREAREAVGQGADGPIINLDDVKDRDELRKKMRT